MKLIVQKTHLNYRFFHEFHTPQLSAVPFSYLIYIHALDALDQNHMEKKL